MEKVDILIVHLGGEDILENCLNSIRKSVKNYEVYLLLNNCRDKSEKIAKKTINNIKIFKTKAKQ